MYPADGNSTKPCVRQVFVSWALKDAQLFESFLAQLNRSLKASNTQALTIRTFSFHRDRRVGRPWDPQIRSAMEQSSGAVFAVSRAFLDSEYIQTIELPYFCDNPSLAVIPVALEPLPKAAVVPSIHREDIIGFERPYMRCANDLERTEFTNLVADEIRIALYHLQHKAS